MSNDYYSPTVIKTHYLAFKEFLVGQDNDIKRQRGAKEKLIKLTNQQFQELSTDVYDELIRRTHNSRECLQSQSEFQPKRNEARAKLAALSQARYRDLSQDIYNEIQRRFPNIVSEADNSTDNPRESTYNMSPVSKNNDTLSQSSIADQQQKINSAPLDDVMSNIKELTNNKNESPNMFEARESDSADISELKKANSLLKSKYDSLNEKFNTERNRLEKELDSIQETLTNRVKINEEQAVEYSKLYNNYTQLQSDIKTLRSQSEVNEKITDELRQENDIQIEKINELTKRNEQLENENKSLKEEIEKLKKELQEEKEKVEAAAKLPAPAKEPEVQAAPTEKEEKDETPEKTPETPQKEESKSPAGPSEVQVEAQQESQPEPQPENSAVKDCINPERFNSYREAVNELIAASKNENPADVLVAMKSIVITCKNITEESDEYERLNENTFTDEEQDKLIDIKNSLSIALTNLMTVTKNHATNYPNVSPSSIENAASDLSITIVSLVRTLKEHQNRLLGQGTASTSTSQQPQINQAAMNMGEYTPNNEQVYNVQELKHYLEEKTDLIVQGIQSLLQKIQQPDASPKEFNDDIIRITGIVDNVIGASQNTFSSQVGIHLYDSGEPILQDLKMGNQRLREMGLSMQYKNEEEIRTIKPNLASASYEIAVFVRDLLELLG